MAGKRYRVVGIDLKLGDGKYVPEGEEVELDEKDAEAVGRWLVPVNGEAPKAPATTPPKAAGNGGKKAAASK